VRFRREVAANPSLLREIPVLFTFDDRRIVEGEPLRLWTNERRFGRDRLARDVLIRSADTMAQTAATQGPLTSAKRPVPISS